MEQNENKILLHCCCAICSGYPLFYLKELGYSPVAYFCNPNIDTKEEFESRLDAQRKLCSQFNIELFVEDYAPDKYLSFIKGFENEPEKGLRCNKCIELRLIQTFEKAKELKIPVFTTSLTISPHKNFNQISQIAGKITKNSNIEYLAIDFKKKDGFLKTNNIAKELNLYRQKYCGCSFAKKHLENVK